LPERPRIVAERKRRAREMKPPQDFMIHEWGKPYSGIEVYISQVAFDKMMKQCAVFAKRHLEAMGYLVGDYCRWKNKEYTIIEDAVTSDLETTSVSVHFQAFEKAFDQLDKIDFDYVIVGWYHSHPGHGCFMSQTDISTQKRMFNKPFHSAIVVDPINKEFKVYKMMGNVPEEKVFAIYKNLDGEGPPTPTRIGGREGQSASKGDGAPRPGHQPAFPPAPLLCRVRRRRRVRSFAPQGPAHGLDHSRCGRAHDDNLGAAGAAAAWVTSIDGNPGPGHRDRVSGAGWRGSGDEPGGHGIPELQRAVLPAHVGGADLAFLYDSRHRRLDLPCHLLFS
jgi:26S proteasome regulatory subunit N11